MEWRCAAQKRVAERLVLALNATGLGLWPRRRPSPSAAAGAAPEGAAAPAATDGEGRERSCAEVCGCLSAKVQRVGRAERATVKRLIARAGVCVSEAALCRRADSELTRSVRSTKPNGSASRSRATARALLHAPDQ